MDIIQVREFLMSLPLCEETFPFGDDFAVFKIEGRMFACLSFERPAVIAVKCDPDRAVLLRDRHGCITAAWHFNKRHWNDIEFVSLDEDIVKCEITHSYLTVIKKNVTPKVRREELLSIAEDAGLADSTVEDLE